MKYRFLFLVVTLVALLALVVVVVVWTFGEPGGRGVAELPPGAIHRLRPERSAHEQVYEIAFLPDRETLASMGNAGEIRLWDLGTGNLLDGVVESGASGRAAVFSPDGSRLAEVVRVHDTYPWIAGRGVIVRDTTMWEHTNGIPVQPQPVRHLAFTPDGKGIATVDEEQNVVLLDLATGTARVRFQRVVGGLGPLVFSPDGKVLAMGSNTIRLWTVATGALVASMPAPHYMGPNDLAFSPDGKTLASASGNAVRLWDVSTGLQTRAFQGGRWDHGFFAVAFSPDGETVAGGTSGGIVYIWRTSTAGQILRCEAHADWVHCLAYSPDGKILASGSWDGTVLLLHVPAGVPKGKPK
jgi:WD40 repeat protein